MSFARLKFRENGLSVAHPAKTSYVEYQGYEPYRDEID